MPDRLRSVQLAWRAAFSEIGKASPAERFFTGQELAITNLKKRRFDCVSKSFGVCGRVSEDHLSLYGGDAHRHRHECAPLPVHLPTDPAPATGGIAGAGIRGVAGGGHRRLRGPIRCPICKGPVPLPPGGLQHPEKPAGFPPGKAGAAAPGRDPGEGRGRPEEDVH